MQRLPLVTVLLCLCAVRLTAAAPQNADSLPPGWGKSGNRPNDYAAGVDRAVYRTGQASGQLRSLVPAVDGTGVFSQAVRADAFAGSRIRVSAWLRTRAVNEVRFFVRVDGSGGVLDFGNGADDPMTGTVEWRKREVVVDVPADALGVVFGFVLQGVGTVWIDDVAVEIVPRDTPRTGVAPEREPVAADVEKMLRERYAAKPTKPQNLGFEDGARY